MALALRQSTASQEIPLGQFVDTDGAVVTGLTISNTDIKIWKTGATTLANKNSGGATEISNGVYYCVLDATDTDTLGPLVIFITEAGALSVRVECVVLSADIYDQTVSPATSLLTVNATQLAGQTITAAAGVTFPSSVASPTNITAGTITTATNVTTVNGLANNVITAASINADAITAAKIADGAIDAATFAASAITSTVLANDAIAAAKIATGAITAAKFAAGAIDAAALAADAGTEIAAAVLAAASADPIHANIEEVNNVQLQGAGTSGDKWRPA